MSLSNQQLAQATVLCVDDEPNILSSLRRLFRARGYRVLTADSGAAGLAVLDSETVDLVISDMRMPEMDGARFLAEVRQRQPDVMRLLLTGYSDIQSILDAINRGEIYRYITKPWDDNDLLLTVRDALVRRGLEQDKQRLEALTRQQNDELKALNQTLEAKVEMRTLQLKRSHDEVQAVNVKLKMNFITTIKLFSGMIEMRGGNLCGHSRRVADLARKIAVEMALPAPEVQEIFIAALLLDIGKIGLTDELLAKPVTLMNGEELGLFRKHPLRAEQLLMALEDLRGAAAILRAQLERFDGAGFPAGLAGLAIPLGARILALAADYDNLQNGAMVKRPLRQEEAKALIYDSSGKRYDPAVVAAFRHLLDGDAAQEIDDVAALSGQLVPGMVLSRDLLSREGLMLLAAEHILDARLIQQVQDFESKSGGRLAIRIHPPKDESGSCYNGSSSTHQT
ncbi:HD domain-containing phosphohydrolase [Janthinobacterium agaricidamnosum]|uniref:Response regulator n=1 Tax=Janthinobacterium agaricidamnosum NBRC 102515 = DSM 9628 TaxID=1349767 RepID=W0V9M8_9BURK|nr:HD domain-containing phosphohydrolase [Janthinobacterium agaricidamnosum]CDG84320.1 response regulator [Janthinobacterium agaricidamnosum NBRC 102515 = DSM 9628]